MLVAFLEAIGAAAVLRAQIAAASVIRAVSCAGTVVDVAATAALVVFLALLHALRVRPRHLGSFADFTVVRIRSIFALF